MRMTSLLMLIGFAAFAQTKLPPAATRKVDYEKDVQPLLAQKCYACHGENVQQSGLRLDKRQNALRGGDYGPVIKPGNSAESKLIRRLVNGDGGLQMPPTGPLSDDEIGMLRAWIDQGAEFRIEIREEAPPKPVDPELANADHRGPLRRYQGRREVDRRQSRTRQAHDQAGRYAAAPRRRFRQSRHDEAASGPRRRRERRQQAEIHAALLVAPR